MERIQWTQKMQRYSGYKRKEVRMIVDTEIQRIEWIQNMQRKQWIKKKHKIQ